MINKISSGEHKVSQNRAGMVASITAAMSAFKLFASADASLQDEIYMSVSTQSMAS